MTRAPDLVRWGPVIAGVVIGLGFFALIDTLWLAIAASAGGAWVSGNLAWFVGITAAVSLLLAGLFAGLLAGVRGMLAGMANGVAAWAVVLILSLTVLAPGALRLTGTIGSGLQPGTASPGGGIDSVAGGLTADAALWATFWSLLAGLVLAAIGGFLGGKMRRPVERSEDSARNGEAPATVATPHRFAGDGDREQGHDAEQAAGARRP
ncbi:MAG: hypothetical protein L0H84_20235 [Pseudonocardia sp.]|nr:hypothetical protein [Pseudonocardia sp.]